MSGGGTARRLKLAMAAGLELGRTWRVPRTSVGEGDWSRQDSADSTGGAVRGCRLRLAQKLSSDSSGSIPTSFAASRHRSAGLRRRPSSSKMRTSIRVRPSSVRTSSRAALALAGWSITSVTPAPEVTVNFMARSVIRRRSPELHHGRRRRPLNVPKGNPTPEGVSTRGGRQCACWRTSVPAKNLRLM